MTFLPYFCVGTAFVLGFMIGYEAASNSNGRKP